jgi:hypothetical protein
MVGGTWSRIVKFKFNDPKSANEILALNFWWNKIIHPWDVGFSKNKAIEFHGLGWVSMSDVWVGFYKKICIQRKNG